MLGDQRHVRGGMFSESVHRVVWFKMLDLKSAAVVTILEEAPSLDEDWTRVSAFEVILRICEPDPKAFTLTLPLCKSKDESLRSISVSALSNLSDSSSDSIDLFGKFLQDPAPVVQWAAMDALAERHGRAAKYVPEIMKLLDSKEVVRFAVSNHFAWPEEVSWRAAKLLGEIGQEAELVLPKLKAIAGPESPKNVRVWSAFAICQVSKTRPTKYLRLLGDLLLDDMQKDFTMSDTVEAITLLGTKAVSLVPVLEQAKAHADSTVRLSLVDAFYAVDPGSALKRSLPLIDDENRRVASSVIRNLSERQILDRKFVAACARVVARCDGFSDEAAVAAVSALSKLGPRARSAIPALEELSRQPEITESLKRDVEEALAKLR